jgi:hypothetical protein
VPSSRRDRRKRVGSRLGRVSALKRYWKWGPVSLGVGTGVGLLFTEFPEWGIGLIAVGFLVAVLLVVVPAALNSISTRLVRRAHRLQGLPWPPVDPHQVQREQAERARMLLAAGKIINELEQVKHILEASDRLPFFRSESLPTQDWLAAGGVLTELTINLPAHVSTRRAYRFIADVNRSIDRTTDASGEVSSVAIDEERAAEALEAINGALADLGELEQ